MHTLTNKSGFLQFFRAADAGVASETDVSRTWPAPAKKTETLALKKPSLLAADAFTWGASAVALSNPPFSAPVREDAFELPRPAVVPGASAAWAPPQRKSAAAVLGGGGGAGSEVEFSRPPRFTEKLSMRHGQFCRSC